MKTQQWALCSFDLYHHLAKSWLILHLNLIPMSLCAQRFWLLNNHKPLGTEMSAQQLLSSFSEPCMLQWDHISIFQIPVKMTCTVFPYNTTSSFQEITRSICTSLSPKQGHLGAAGDRIKKWILCHVMLLCRVRGFIKIYFQIPQGLRICWLFCDSTHCDL